MAKPKKKKTKEPGFYQDGKKMASYFICPDCGSKTYFGAILDKPPIMALTIIDKPK